MIRNTYKQPEILGGIISTDDGSALTVGPTAMSRTGCSNDSVNVLVDSGSSGHFFDDAIMPGLRDRLKEYKVLDVPRKIPTAGGGELMSTAAFLGNRAPHSAIGIQSPYKMLHGTEPDLRLIRVIGARAFVHIETYSKKLELKAVEGRLVGYSNNSKSYRVYNPATRRIMESRNVNFIETPSRLFPPPL